MPVPTEHDVVVAADGRELPGSLVIPAGATGLVAFAHGSGSSRFSTRNRRVADDLNEAGLATLLFDLLTAPEHRLDQQTREYRFDIGLLGRRLTGAVDWLGARPDTRDLRLGLFGASTGAAAALVAAAERPDQVAAVVSRGGRADLAAEALEAVRAPTLLIVGARDAEVLELNRNAGARIRCHHELAVIPGATHLFEEPGTLETAAARARDWFLCHLSRI